MDAIFGIPGVHTLPIYDALRGSPLRRFTTRHEQGAAFMADGYARVTGRPGTCLLITGPGLTNALTPIAQAYHDSIPLLALSSTPSRGAPLGSRGRLHQLPDQQALMSQVTAFSRSITEPEELPTAFAEAFALFESARPRPVHIELPVDLLSQPCGRLAPQRAQRCPPSPDPDGMARAASLLDGAARPLLLLGGGARDAGREALDLATRVDAVVVTTINGKGAVPESHPSSLGATLPLAPVRWLVHDADVLLAVGTEFSEVDILYSSERLTLAGTLIRVDIDAAEIAAGPSAAVSLVGDARTALSRLLQTTAASARRSADGRVRHCLEQIEWTAATQLELPWLDALRAATPADTVFSLDSTQPAYSAHHYLGLDHARSWLAPVGYGALGPGLPMALGALVGSPDRPTVALVGDAGLLFTVQELATAADIGRPLPVVLWNNAGYGEIRRSFLEDLGSEPIECDITAPDFGSLARGLGAEWELVRSPEELETSVRRALRARGPTVLEVPASHHGTPRTPPLSVALRELRDPASWKSHPVRRDEASV